MPPSLERDAPVASAACSSPPAKSESQEHEQARHSAGACLGTAAAVGRGGTLRGPDTGGGRRRRDALHRDLEATARDVSLRVRGRHTHRRRSSREEAARRIEDDARFRGHRVRRLGKQLPRNGEEKGRDPGEEPSEIPASRMARDTGVEPVAFGSGGRPPMVCRTGLRSASPRNYCRRARRRKAPRCSLMQGSATHLSHLVSHSSRSARSRRTLGSRPRRSTSSSPRGCSRTFASRARSA